LLARPTGRALFLAKLRADTFAQMVDTEARLTFAILTAGVEEAAFARVTFDEGNVRAGVEEPDVWFDSTI